MPRLAALLLISVVLAQPVLAETVEVTPTQVMEWKAVYGRIEARDRVPARARIGGTVVELNVAEGDFVAEGQPLASVVDDKLTFQLGAIEAQKAALSAQLANAETELTRGEELLKQGVSTVQRLDALRTQVEVLRGQIATIEAQAEVIRQSQAEGLILAPAAGRVLDVPVSTGAVIMPGEPLALLSVGGTFLRLAVPERHASMLQEGRDIGIESPDGPATGRLVKVYPLVENGRVIADVEVEGLSDRLIDARVLVRLPMGERSAIVVPSTALISEAGLDFVQVETAQGTVMRAVVPGQQAETEDKAGVEILSGLEVGDRVVIDPSAGVDHE